ncbi:hypothetical protein LDO26_00490 [Luteimonas sp. BDR2-5]|uniref:hypothetical protein n=1 Tax=Proluteimonas luteida TaxID=2878685 RepID=UPI001E5D44C9|nr:hypothetical protein [Luteimonas sp. BDR2-5]MCD9026691.1 hypothetical protein [Luteimonas sp. BDR2-5]
MTMFDELEALERLPLDREIRWSQSSLGLDVDVFDGVHRRLERLEGAGRVRIVRADSESDGGRHRVVRVVFRRVA